MRAFFVCVPLICVLFFEAPCSSQIAKSESETINRESVGVHAASTGDNCFFREGNDVDSHPNCVLQNGQGKLFIAQDYVKALEFDSYGLAVVFDDGSSRHGWMYVNRKGHVVIGGVPISDNWADAFSEGLVRTVINEKYGFADRHGKIVIAAKYDGALPFEHGYALVCIGCRETCVLPDHPHAGADRDCEHHIMTGGEWFKINKAGHVMARVCR